MIGRRTYGKDSKPRSKSDCFPKYHHALAVRRIYPPFQRGRPEGQKGDDSNSVVNQGKLLDDYYNRHIDEFESTEKYIELYARLSERLEQILEEFKNNWAELRKALEQLRRDIKAGRAKENTYGYDATHEMPFLGLLKTEFFGKKAFEELSDEQMTMMKNLTDDVLNRFKQETVAVNFWNNVALQQELRTYIIKQLISPEIKKFVPDIVKRRKDIAQKLMELGYQHFGRDD